MADAALLALIARWCAQGGAPLIGIAGAQGSGKSTLAAAAAAAIGAAHFSLDDVYRTRAERAVLARETHPLFATRGPPGTHDLELAAETITALRRAGQRTQTPIPAFDKLSDDRMPQEAWPVFTGRPAAILLEGWCVGATAQPDAALVAPVNDLERARDRDGVWRRSVNAALAGPYAAFFGGFDAILHLAAPSWDIVLKWRSEQEAGLLGLAELPPARRDALAVFVAHYERITRHMLAGGVRADATARLAEDRSLTDLRLRP